MALPKYINDRKLRKNKKVFRRSQSILSTTLAQQPTKPRGNVSLIPSLKANNKQLAAALDEAKRKVRRGEERILKLQKERQELLEQNAKSTRCIQSLQLNLPRAEQLLQEADVRIAGAKESVVQAKQLTLECCVGECSGKSIFNVASGSSSGAMRIEQPMEFDPILASTPQNSPPAQKGIDVACSMFDDAFKDELSISLTESLETLASSQDQHDASLCEISAEESTEDQKVDKDVISLPVRSPRPKRHCTELRASYAEGDLARKFSRRQDVQASDVPVVPKQKKFLKKPSSVVLRNITNVI